MKFNVFSKLAFLAVSSLALPVYAASVEAKKDGVQVLAAPQNKAEVLSTLNKGDAVTAKERKGMYWEVDMGGKTGYVSVLAVAHKPGDGGSLSKAIRNAVSKDRPTDQTANARARSAVMGVRGLDESGQTAFAGNVKPNLRLVYGMEDRQVSRDAIENIEKSVMTEVAAKAQQP